MFSTYRPEDVTILLKDISGLVKPLATAEREKLIQSGVHYSAMLPLEYEPTAEYLRIYEEALKNFAPLTAQAVADTAAQIWQSGGERTVLVSLARAGTPIGILIKHYLEKNYHAPIPHYTISIIRGRGIDRNAMNYILARHSAVGVQFVDGWVGKGAIKRELETALIDFPTLTPNLAVLSDPAGVADICGTREDFLIASSCLNSTVSGLLSRTFWREDIISPTDFHGAAFYENLRDRDLTYQFIDAVEECFPPLTKSKKLYNKKNSPAPGENSDCDGLSEVREICRNFRITDINLVKPGIGEATRVLLRRLPEVILVHSLTDERALGHIYRLAKEKGTAVKEYPLRNYRACGIIRRLGDA